MNNLKKYTEYIVETQDSNNNIISNNTKSNNIDDLFDKLKNKIENKIDEKNKIIINFYKDFTIDGKKIEINKSYYAYGRYTDIQYKGNKNMEFEITIKEKTDNGFTYTVNKSLSNSNLTNIDIKSIIFMYKESKLTDKLKEGYINGKYLVKDINNIKLIKPIDDKKDNNVDNKKDNNLINEDDTIKEMTDILIKSVNNYDDNEKKEVIKQCEKRINIFVNEINNVANNDNDDNIKKQILINKKNIDLLKDVINIYKK
jgi:hypothetical protein